MQHIIPPIPRNLLKKELTKDKLLRKSNFNNKDIYVFTHKDSPNLIKEVGRLRELTFRNAGGGTGKEMDIDKYDISEKPYNQLIVWDPKREDIIGGYRYMIGKDAEIDENGKVQIATTGLFNLSEKFITEYFPQTIELGRSFVQPNYQMRSAGRDGMYALDNLWDGLGALVIDHPDIKYFFGKVTMYTSFNKYARDLILYFLKTNFPDKEKLVYPISPIDFDTDVNELKKLFPAENYTENYKILSKLVREKDELIPPLINAYMNLSSTMISFGTAINKTFGEVEETGILITIKDIYENKKERHVNSYKQYLKNFRQNVIKRYKRH